MATITGGDKLNKALAALGAKARNAASVSIGFQDHAVYPNSTTLVAMVAAIQEFGAPSRGIPPRPFFRDMIADKSPKWPDQIAKGLLANEYDADKTLGQMGELIRGQLQESINEFDGVPLSPVTIAAKGFNKQLISTSTMLKSITSVVK